MKIIAKLVSWWKEKRESKHHSPRIGIDHDGGSLHIDGAEISNQDIGIRVRNCKPFLRNVKIIPKGKT